MIDVADAVLLARYLAADPDVKVSSQGLANADCNQDQNRDDQDILLILKHIAKLVILPEKA